MDLYLDERDRAEGLWAQLFRPVRLFAVTIRYSFLLFLSAGISAYGRGLALKTLWRGINQRPE